jgi:hypothetical protein
MAWYSTLNFYEYVVGIGTDKLTKGIVRFVWMRIAYFDSED